MTSEGTPFASLAAADDKELSPPKPDELEVTVIGGGTGEAILVHVGSGRWAVIDCFDLPPVDLPPAPAQYLLELGYNLPEAVAGVVLTHPHHDHYNGIDLLLSLCKGSEDEHPPFYVSGALSDKGWRRYLAAERTESPRFGGQLSSAFATSHQSRSLVPVQYLSSLQGDLNSLRVLAPDPSLKIDEIVFESTKADRVPNLVSVVLALEIQKAVALLTGDFELNREYGWEAVLDRHTKAGSVPPAGLLKVPHHGSEGSNNRELVSALTADDFAAVTTRNNNPRGGKGALPDQSVMDVLQGLARSSHLVGGASLLNEDSGEPQSKLGWATARTSPSSGTWTVEAFGAVSPRSA